MTLQRRRLLVAVIVPVEVGSAALAWRDLSGRADDQVRGPRNLWRAVILLHPGNSVLYWLFGRCRDPRPPSPG